MSLVLTVTSYHRLSPDLQVRQTVADGPFVIGRDAACDWALVDTEKLMSKRHLTIARAGQGYQVTDTSLNGTFLNDDPEPIGRGVSRSLADGDRLRLSDYEIAVTIAPDAAADARSGAWDGDDPPAAHAPPGAAAPPVFDTDGGPAEPAGWPPPAAAAPDGAVGAAALPPNAALLDDDPEAEPAPGDMPPWSADSERVALRPMRPVIPDNWLDEPDSDVESGDRDAPPDPMANATAPVRGNATRAAPEAEAPPQPGPGAPLESCPPADAPGEPTSASPTPPHAPAAPAPGVPAPGVPAPAAEGMAAFLRGAGLPPDAVSAGDSDAALEAAGRLFATMVAGLTDVLATRSEVRNEFRLQQTVIRPRENNPLKFSATTEDALRALLNGRKQGYMPPQQAVEEAVDDVKAHQIAVMAGVQAAVKGLLTRFDPDSLQRRFGAERGVLGLGAGKGRAWDAFVRLYADIAAEAEDDFHAVLGREFAKAYEACGRERGRRP